MCRTKSKIKIYFIASENHESISPDSFFLNWITGESGHGNSIYNIIPLLKKENVHVVFSKQNVRTR